MKNMSKAPACPTCGRRMVLTSVSARLEGARELHTYACKACDVSFAELDTGDEPLPERVCALNFEAGQVLTRQ